MNLSTSSLRCLAVMPGLAFLVVLGSCGSGASDSTSLVTPSDKDSQPAASMPDQPPTRRARDPAVAGLFYPAEPNELSATLDKLLAAAPPSSIPRLRALICPHAGYEYSGPTAAIGYKQLSGRNVRTVILMAPSHYARFDGVSVLDADAYHTPLGSVQVSPQSAELTKTKPFRLEPRGGVRRPPWVLQSPKKGGPPADDTPETWEHSGEVQIPFMQKALKDFQLVSLVFGQVDPQQVAQGLAPRLDKQTLLVASSDLSHYHPYDEAKALDSGCVKAICDLDLDKLKDAEACGVGPIQTLVHLARLNGWKTKLLDYRNSGDTAGDKRGVVGYAAIAFFEPESSAQFSTSERRQLLALARRTLQDVVRTGKLPEPDLAGCPPSFARPGACFVTLTKRGNLRGCIGNMVARLPLYQAMLKNARAAALNDYRFEPVKPDELGDLEIEISVLTEPRPLSFGSPDDLLTKLRPHVDGVVLRMGFRSATFLPQVWEKLPDKVTFLNHLAQKAGCPPDAWREPGTKVEVYQVEAFSEGKTH